MGGGSVLCNQPVLRPDWWTAECRQVRRGGGVELFLVYCWLLKLALALLQLSS